MKIEIGQYIPGNSFIHRLDPRTKILVLVIMMSAIFSKTNSFNLLAISVFVLICFFTVRISYSTIINSIKATWFMLFFLLILNIFIIKKGDVLFVIPNTDIEVYSIAVYTTLYVVWRIVLSISLSIVLTSTTDQLKLALGLEKLFSPLQKIKIPISTLATMVSIALRFIPMVLDDFNRISKAQASRGLDFENGSIKTKIKSLFTLVIPLIMSLFTTADELALSMEARNYNPKVERPRYRNLTMHKRDITILILIAIYMFLLIAL